jgi:hypothetical protein
VVPLIKPKAATLADPTEALKLAIRVHEALAEVQELLGAPTSESVAAGFGKVQLVKLAGATVTDVKTGRTFTADVYVPAVAL